jgi:hypothetical protein
VDDVERTRLRSEKSFEFMSVRSECLGGGVEFTHDPRLEQSLNFRAVVVCRDKNFTSCR